jgi:hypothetical protein
MKIRSASWQSWLVERERGDVPGWVMVTIMSSALVVALITAVSPQLQSVFSTAITNVAGTK